MEFKLEKFKEAEISFNFQELKTALKNNLEKYKNLVYTDENISTAKADKAALNKFRKAIEDKRIELKNKCLEPYNSIEKQVKELVSLVDDVILPIDTQVKAFEDKKAQAKREELEAYFNEKADSEIKGIISFEKIFNSKWLNATYSIKKAKEDIDLKVNTIRTELDTLLNFKLSTPETMKLINAYLENLSLTKALAEKTKLEALKSNLTTLENKTNETIEEDNKPVLNDNTYTSRGTEIDFGTKYKVVFEVEATKEQLQMIKRFLQENKIKYGSVK